MSRRKGLGVGSVSLILIFSVLCLTIFCLLSLSTARSDASLANASAEGIRAYYEADTKAERVCAALARARSQGERPQELLETQITYDEGGCAAYSCKVDERHFIAVVIDRSGNVLQWLQMDDGSWTADESLKVWGSSRND